MMGQRIPLLLLLAAFASAALVSPVIAQGSNATTALTGKLSDKQGLVAGAIDPKTGQSVASNGTNPFSYPYGQQASGIYGGAYTGAYYTPAGGVYGSTYNAYSGGYGGYGGAGTGLYMGTPYGLNVGGGYGFGSAYAGGYAPGSNYAGNYGLTYGSNYAGGYANGGAAGYGYGAVPPSYSYGNAAGYSGTPYAGSYGYGGGYGNGIGSAYINYGGGANYGVTTPYYGYNRFGILPGLAGAAVGAMVGKHFGVVGLIAGGIGGFVVGSWLSSQARQMPYSGLYDNYNSLIDANMSNRYAYSSGLSQYFYGRTGSSSLGMMPGLAGAVMGAVIGKHAGITGMLIGGVVGFVGGQLLGKVLFPQNQYNQYGGYYQDPYNNINNFRQSALPSQTAANQTSGGGVVVKPYAPSTSADGSLSQLRTNYFNAMDSYQKALSTGATNEKTAARQSFEDAQSKYLKAKEAAGGAQ
jgi:hypothetical protein